MMLAMDMANTYTSMGTRMRENGAKIYVTDRVPTPTLRLGSR